MPQLSRVLDLATRRWGDRRWDLFLWTIGVAALAAIPLVIAFPSLVPLVWFALIALLVNGPFSPILPVQFEIFIMDAAKYHPAIWVTLVGLSAQLYMEYLNWHIYTWLFSWERFAGLRGRRIVRWGVQQFARWPFGTVVVFAFSPLPFWVVRCLAVLQGYRLRRYISAMAIGRFPRLFAYAWAGAVLQIPTVLLLGVAAAMVVLALGWRLARRERLFVDAVLEGSTGSETENQPGSS